MNRIVLYIDDLDRCNDGHGHPGPRGRPSAARVSPVRRAPSRSTRAGSRSASARSHEQLFVGGRPRTGPRATVGDYLEKNFQIPIWMSPIEAPGVPQLVNSLLGTTAAPPPRRGATGQGVINASTEQKAEPEGGAYTGASLPRRARGPTRC